jgi:cation diffusion facilitator CzcD-associated flavoprotein CzcO
MSVSDKKPSVIIIGTGVSGIGAARRKWNW